MQLRPLALVSSVPMRFASDSSFPLLAASAYPLMILQSFVSFSPMASATSETGMLLESSRTNASKRSVKPLGGDTHGTFAVLTPCFSHLTLGTLTLAWMNALYWKKFRRLQALSCVSWALHFSQQPSSWHSNGEPFSKPMAMCSSGRVVFPSRAKLTSLAS